MQYQPQSPSPLPPSPPCPKPVPNYKFGIAVPQRPIKDWETQDATMVFPCYVQSSLGVKLVAHSVHFGKHGTPTFTVTQGAQPPELLSVVYPVGTRVSRIAEKLRKLSPEHIACDDKTLQSILHTLWTNGYLAGED